MLQLFRKIAIASVTVCLLSTPIIAAAADDTGSMPANAMSEHRHDRGMRHHHKAMMQEMKNLNVSSDQWTRIRNLETSFSNAHHDSRPSQADMKKYHDDMMAILKPNQRGQFISDMKKAHGGKYPHQGDAGNSRMQ